MAKNQAMKNLRTAGYSAANYTAKTTGKTAVGLFRWAATDHSGMSKALEHMPEMGFIDTFQYILMQFLFAVAAAVLTGIWVFVLIGYGIPLLLTGSF